MRVLTLNVHFFICLYDLVFSTDCNFNMHASFSVLYFHFDFCILLVEYEIVSHFLLTFSDPFLNSNTSKLRNVCENFIYR